MLLIVQSQPWLIMVYATGSAIDDEVGPSANVLLMGKGSNITAVL